MGQLRSFGTAPDLTFPPIEVRVISVAPRVDIAARRPSVPLPRHLAHPVGLLRGKIVHFGAIGRHVEELPRLLEARDEFRSEEHTSELQSLMRISYAVFCLKK